MENTITSKLKQKEKYDTATQEINENQENKDKSHATNNEDYIVRTENSTIYYGDFQAIKNVNMRIKKNAITAFIGPSGCGKSTFLRAFNRMNDFIKNFHLSGKIYVEGTDIYNEKINVEQLRKDAGMVFQKPNPFPKSIFENVAYGLKIQGIKDKKVIESRVSSTLKKVGLWKEVSNDLNRNALSLSGGQQQRLCIARTLAVKPSIILMDEPTSALDPISTAKIEDLITQLKRDYTIIIVTHNMQQASRISDYTAFLYMGNLIEYDATSKLFTNPEHKRTEDYITGRFG